MLLTRYEHVVAHYYLTTFENKRWYHSALMAFIQVSSLKKEDIDSVTEINLEDLVNKVVKAREEYFGSDAHRQGSAKAGAIAGKKRKERMQNDSDFRRYIVGRMKNLSPEQEEAKKKKFLATVRSTAPWDRGGAKKKLSKVQDWKYAEAVFTFANLGFSYKKLAQYYNVEHKTISNIFRILREDYAELKSFKDWAHYGNFIQDFQDRPIVDEEAISLFCTVPWKKGSKAWVNIDKIYNLYKEDKKSLTYGRLKLLTNPNSVGKIRQFCHDMEGLGVENINEWVYYKLWLQYRQEFLDSGEYNVGCSENL